MTLAVQTRHSLFSPKQFDRKVFDTVDRFLGCIPRIDVVLGGALYEDAVRLDSPYGYWRLGEIASYAQTILMNKPLAYWRLNEAAGAGTVADASGNGKTGTVGTGVTLGNGSPLTETGGGAASFPGTDAAKITATAIAMGGLSTFSLELWVKPDTAAAPNNFRMAWSWAGAGDYLGWTDTVAPYYIISLFIGGAQRTASFGPMTVGAWTHLVVTYNGAQLKTYRNGVLYSAQSITGTIDGTTGNMLVGNYGTAGYGWSGFLDEVAVYNRTLGAAEIANHYALRTSLLNAGTALVADDLVGTHDGAFTGEVVTGALGAVEGDTPDTAMTFGAYYGGVNLTGVPVFGHFSFECWIYPTANTNNFRRLWSSGSVVTYPFDLGFDAANHVIFFLNFTTLTPGWIVTPIVLPVGAWYYVVFTWDGNAVRIFINGVQQYVNETWAGRTLINVGSTAGHRAIGNLSTDDGGGVGGGAYYEGVIDEVAYYDHVLAPDRIAAHYQTGRWVSLMPDVLSEPGIIATRGIAGTGPNDRVCQPGTLEFTLDNGKTNSATRPSWYSPTHPDARPGWMEGCPVRLVATFRDADYPLWRGRIRTIAPTPGRTPMRVGVLAQDAAADLSTAIVPNIPPQINKTEVQLLDAVVGALPVDARPPVLFDGSLDSYPFAFDNTGENAIALGLIASAVMSAIGTSYIDARGRLRYRNRQVQAATEPSLTIADGDLLYRGPGFAGASSLRNVFNRFRITIHPKSTTPSIVLFRSTATIELVPGAAFEVWDNYSDPNNPDRLIGGYNFAAVTPTTDYLANDNQDGSGANRTADLSVTVEPFIAAAKSTLVNTSATPFFVTMRQLRGTGIFDNAPVILEASTPKNYGDRVASVDLPFQASAIKAQNLADYFLAQYADRGRAGEELCYLPQRSAALMTGAVTLDIGAVVTASELTSGVINVPYEIRGITYAFERVRTVALLVMKYRIVPHVSGAPGSAAWTFDHPVYGLLDSGTVFGFA